MKPTEQYFLVVLFIMPYKVCLVYEPVDDKPAKTALFSQASRRILKCDHLNESHWAVLSCGSLYRAKQGQWF